MGPWKGAEGNAENYRDVFFEGECDLGAELLARELSWPCDILRQDLVADTGTVVVEPSWWKSKEASGVAGHRFRRNAFGRRLPQGGGLTGACPGIVVYSHRRV